MSNDETVEETAAKIRSMEIRGAGKIARAAASAMKNYALTLAEDNPEKFLDALTIAKNTLFNTRPTAVSLANALEMVMRGAKGDSIADIRAGVAAASDKFNIDSVSAVEKIAKLCASKINDGNTIITHCNSSVAVQGMINAYKQGKKIKVMATETRPWHQGYITSQALADAGIETTLIVDSAARFFMAETDLVIVGADTVTSDGSVVNKIGTSQIAVCAHERGVPMYVCAESYKFSQTALTGESVPIEERDIAEIIEPGKLKGVKIRNPVFDYTPPQYIKAIITELGEISPHDAISVIEHLKS